MLYREFRMDGLLVVGVALRESPDAVKGFAEELGITFPLLVDPKGGSMSLFGLRGHPSTVLIDRQGRVAGLVRGERAWYGEEGKALVRQLLEPTE